MVGIKNYYDSGTGHQRDHLPGRRNPRGTVLPAEMLLPSEWTLGCAPETAETVNERQLRHSSSSGKRSFESLLPHDVRRSCVDRQADIQLFRVSLKIIYSLATPIAIGKEVMF